MLSKPTRQAQTEAEAKFKRRQDQARDGVKAAAEYEAAAVAMREKTARLRAQRLAREAADEKAVADKKGEIERKKGK
jgi:hypothetical protein